MDYLINKWGRWNSLKKSLYAAMHCHYCHRLMIYRPWLFPRRLWAVMNQGKVIICPYCRKRRLFMALGMMAASPAVAMILLAKETAQSNENECEGVRKLLKDADIVD